LVRQWG
jgi:hypothetical protein